MRYYSRKVSGPAYRLPLLAFMCLYSTAALPQNSIKIGDVQSVRSEKLSGSFNVAIGARGPEIEVPFAIINGTGEGPVIAMTAGVNDYNNSPYQALQRIKNELDPEHLSGTVVILHTVTTPSMLKRKIYHNPLEGLNLNRVYPGKSTGSIGERITYRIREEIIDMSDYLIDIQCQEPDEDMIPFTTCPTRGNPFVVYKTRVLAYNFGFGIIVNDHYSRDNSNATIHLGHEAFISGKPSVTVVAGKPGNPDGALTESIVNGIRNILRYLKMIEGKPKQISDQIWIKRIETLKSEFDGMFYPLTESDNVTQQGQVIGQILDSNSGILQEFTSPFNGVVHFIREKSPVRQGIPLIAVGEL